MIQSDCHGDVLQLTGLPSSRPLPGPSLLARPWVQALILLSVGLVLRMAAFGDPNVDVDESFYLLVGHEMHHGALPYVDIWDRKPLGLFIIYWVFAFFGDGVLAYQIGAWLAASATAFVMNRICARWMPPAAALTAGLAYLATVGALGGIGGQSPIFYNLLVAGGALLVLQYLAGAATARLYLAMLLLGLAITVKQTTAFEAAFLGLAGVWHHRDWRKTLIQVAIGSAPFAAISLWYAWSGHWSEYYHSMVTASTTRPPMQAELKGLKVAVMLATIGPLIGVAAYAMYYCRERLPVRFMALWLGAAAAGWASAGYFYDHYALPMLVPLCIAAAAAWTRRPAGPVLALLVMATPLYLAWPVNFEVHRQSREQFDKMVRAIGPLPGATGLLVFGGPPLLYAAANAHPMSPLAFPCHIADRAEKDMGPRKTAAEIERIVALRPAAVVMYVNGFTPPDAHAYGELMHYVRTSCRAPVRATSYDDRGNVLPQLIYSGCR